MTNLDSIFKSRDITLPTKVRLVAVAVSLMEHKVAQIFAPIGKKSWTKFWPSSKSYKKEYWIKFTAIAARTQTITGNRFHAKSAAVKAPTMPMRGFAPSTKKTPGKIKEAIAVKGMSLKNFSVRAPKRILSMMIEGSIRGR